MDTFEIAFIPELSRPDRRGMAILKIRIKLNQERTDFSSGIKVPVDRWDKELSTVKGKSAEDHRANLFMLQAGKKLNKIFERLEEDGQPFNGEIIKNIFLGKDKPKATIKEIVKEHRDYFVQMLGRRGYSQATLDKYDVFEEKLDRFLKTKSRKDMYLAELNYNVVYDLQQWMMVNGSHKGEAMDINSVIGNMRKLKKLIGTALKRGLMDKDPFVGIDLTWDDREVAYLELEHIEKLLGYTFASKTLEKVQDRFIVGCFTCMAHSDISKATHEHIIKDINGNPSIKIGRTKTGEPAYIPILPEVQSIIDKYAGEHYLFPQLSLTSMNRYLKEIQQIVGIPVHMTTHTARHTGGQLLSDMGVNIEVIAAVMGHADSKTTKKHYAKTSKKLVTDEMEQFRIKMEVLRDKEKLKYKKIG